MLAVITAEDVPDNLFSFYHWLADKNILCTDKVRYVGDEVAAVAAVDEDTAEEALELIKVEYEPLPAVFELDEAMQPGAPLVHEDKESNSTWTVQRLFGDPDKALAECDSRRRGHLRHPSGGTLLPGGLQLHRQVGQERTSSPSGRTPRLRTHSGRRSPASWASRAATSASSTRTWAAASDRSSSWT